MKTPDYEKEAWQSSRETSKFKNRSKQTSIEAEGYKKNIEKINSSVTTLENSIKNMNEVVKNNYEELQNNYKSILTIKESMIEHVESLNQIFQENPDLEESMEQLSSRFEEGEEYLSKIKALQTYSNKKTLEIQKLHQEIYGFTTIDPDTKKESKVEGLQTELERSYDSLEKNAQDIENNYKKNIVTIQNTYDSTINEWHEEYLKLKKTIESLLPGALTAGLSKAYAEKKNHEKEEFGNHQKSFNNAIQGLIVSSFVSILGFYFITFNGYGLEKITVLLPKFALFLLPLYTPILWVAYSANKKVNLSKRLIEEYAHKEVLSKTYEGLSSQISDIQNTKTHEELKNKLLYNLLEVSSENPGKLISNYNKSDHPLLDVLEKSIQFANAISKAEKVPGLTNVANIFGNKAQKETEMVNESVKMATAAHNASTKEKDSSDEGNN